MEILDIYDENKVKTDRTYIRGGNSLKNGEYVLVVEAVIINNNGEILLTQRAGNKKRYPLMWECTQGSVKTEESSIEGILRELKEEIGIIVLKEELKLILTSKDSQEHIFKDLWYIKKDLKIEDIKFTDNEVINAKWVNIQEFLNMNNNKELSPNMDFNLKIYNMII